MLGEVKSLPVHSNEEKEQNVIRRPRLFNKRTILDNLTNEEIKLRYRFGRAAILDLHSKLKPYLDPQTKRNHAISGIGKLLATLHFLASGSFQTTVSAVSGCSQPTFSKILNQVLAGITSLAPQLLHYNMSTNNLCRIKEDFYAMAHMPNVIGAIDCTHIALIPPSDKERLYYNRKGFHSVNVQVVCDAHTKILDVVAKYPGSSHDSFIFRNSHLHDRLCQGEAQEGWLLGDNGYQIKPWLITPLLNAETRAEQRFNKSHKTTRCIIERTFGILKSRFRCLDKTGGALFYRPEKVCLIIFCCCILHNFALVHNENIDGLEDLSQVEDIDQFHAEDTPEGVLVRQQIIDNFF
ncbi:putative nuclease HARBI1 [Xenopus laevis]|uniref:Putative nuclease HARBI1 n=1 Tax=Xenopus laevis TaxID=8355 RepID=A0A8J1L3R1_XENLA|nr:putative nuclease HARBI1 [Xenopus laevis]